MNIYYIMAIQINENMLGIPPVLNEFDENIYDYTGAREYTSEAIWTKKFKPTGCNYTALRFPPALEPAKELDTTATLLFSNEALEAAELFRTGVRKEQIQKEAEQNIVGLKLNDTESLLNEILTEKIKDSRAQKLQELDNAYLTQAQKDSLNAQQLEELSRTAPAALIADADSRAREAVAAAKGRGGLPRAYGASARGGDLFDIGDDERLRMRESLREYRSIVARELSRQEAEDLVDDETPVDALVDGREGLGIFHGSGAAEAGYAQVPGLGAEGEAETEAGDPSELMDSADVYADKLVRLGKISRAEADRILMEGMRNDEAPMITKMKLTSKIVREGIQASRVTLGGAARARGRGKGKGRK